MGSYLGIQKEYILRSFSINFNNIKDVICVCIHIISNYFNTDLTFELSQTVNPSRIYGDPLLNQETYGPITFPQCIVTCQNVYSPGRNPMWSRAAECRTAPPSAWPGPPVN